MRIAALELTYQFPDLIALKRAYMPFVRDGGIFIPTDKLFQLGGLVKVTVTLPEENKQIFTFVGEVIWITPKSSSNLQHAGIGVQCNEDEGVAFRKAVQQLIAGVKETSGQSETM